MRRYPILAALLFTIAASAIGPSAEASAAAHSPAFSTTRPVAFRGHFGGGGRRFFGGARNSSRGRNLLAGRRGGTHGLLRRIARALAFAYILHLIFSHGGVSILFWLVVVGLVVHFVRRRRRRSYAY
jgi:hypothetical protein